MYIIDKSHVITITRGDTISLPIELYNGVFPDRGDKLVLEDGDIIFFGLMLPRQHFECAILKKEFTNKDFDNDGDFVLSLEPLDTMKLIPSTYYYELKLLKKSDNSIKTLIQKSKFIIVD